MSNGWVAGQIAKSITSKKRPRWFWNVFFGTCIALIVIGVLYIFGQTSVDYFKHSEAHVFVEYKENQLITESGSFKVVGEEKQDVSIRKLIKKVKSGDTVILTISDISDELLEVKYSDEVVYKQKLSSMTVFIVFCFILVFPILGWGVFMLVVTNIKNPSKRIDKIQSQFLLRFYDVKKTAKRPKKDE